LLPRGRLYRRDLTPSGGNRKCGCVLGDFPDDRPGNDDIEIYPNITILYDGDPAGIKASFRGIDMVLEQGMNVKIVLFPDNEDPDSFARKNHPAEVEKFITSNALNFISF